LIEQITALFPKTKLVPGKTLLFFDEIQDCDEARASLKFFSQDKRFHIIASGSVLGTSQQSFVPIGSERTIIMHSMDFEEFL
jgi:predicted AAA+ superfamily ATPase